ncbi:hypothetical protein GGR57DRAFT_344394 [Xylariaceae sp. FL1272]|nr:hypothetical protein GGR57DRAFT_344394 [Xylariaceae sp. FL1272]
METTIPEADVPQPIVFRGKKRKSYRQRQDKDTPSVDAIDTIPDAPTPDNDKTSQPEDESSASIASALRLRFARKSKLRGVTFGVDRPNHLDAEEGSNDLDELSQMIAEEEQKAMEQSVVAANKRFAPQTGLSGDIVNKHMEEYIEAELAKRHGASSAHPSSDRLSNANEAKRADEKHTGTAVTGKLFEVDLGEEVRSRNELMTDRARRKMAGEEIEDEESVVRPKKVRLGRDGKVYRPRNRRDSDAAKRDALVDEILRENRLDVYESPTPQPLDDNAGDADERIAEEFRREFLDAMADKQRRKKPVGPPAKPGTKKDEEVLKGPKLGGSRNARAAMRDLLLKQQEGRK